MCGFPAHTQCQPQDNLHSYLSPGPAWASPLPLVAASAIAMSRSGRHRCERRSVLAPFAPRAASRPSLVGAVASSAVVSTDLEFTDLEFTDLDFIHCRMGDLEFLDLEFMNLDFNDFV